jgi:hypothetical protein
MATGQEEDIQTALLVLENPYDKGRDAGLRELQPFADHPRVASAMQTYNFKWPAPEVFDLQRNSVPEETGTLLLREIFRKLGEKGLAPIRADTLLYYVETRWDGDLKKLDTIMGRFKYLIGLNPVRISVLSFGPKENQEKGVNEWERVVKYIDFFDGVNFPNPGALSVEDCK